MKKFGKRLGALMIGAAMLTTTVAASGLMSVASLTADAAAEKTVTIGKELAIPVKNASGDVTNQDETSIRNDVKTLAESGITSLQFNLSAEAEVAEFVFYLGIALEDDPWWASIEPDKSMAPEGTTGNDDHSYKCTPYAQEFSVVVDVSNLDIGYDDTYGEKAYQFENCYTGDTDGNEIAITLESITVNGTTDTSEGEPKGNLNTGGAGYTTANSLSGSSEFKDNGDGTATLKSTITKKIDDVSALYKEEYGGDVILTPSPSGEDYSEEAYLVDIATGEIVKAADVTYDATKYAKASEANIRSAGYLLNGHKFAYKDFGIYKGASETDEIVIESLKVVMRADSGTNVTRIQYGGGLNVDGHSPADTEWTKNQAGLKDDKNAGYWYNDLGTKALEETQDGIDAHNAATGENIQFGVEVQNGQDIRDASFGDYVEVTWDVPADVIPYTTANDSDTISFQLWYGEVEGEEYTPLESLKMESAALTYTQSITFPYQGKVTKTVNEKLLGDAGTEFLFSDFGMEYEYTADVYGIEFTLSAAQGIENLVLGAGTSVRENCSGATADYWFQANNCPSEEDGNSITLINADESKKEYTFLWLMPGKVAKGLIKNASTGKYEGKGTNYISTEEETSNFKLAAYYAGWKDEADNIAVTVDDITLYYTTDDRNNAAKADMFEDDLFVRPETLEMEVGDEETLTANVEDCTFVSGDIDVVTVDNKGNVTAVGAGETTITVTTPHGQVKEVTVVVTDPFVPLYGDTNLDGKVSLIDVVYLNKYNAGAMTFNDQQLENADCVYDGKVGLNDATILLQYLVEIVDKVGPGAVEV